MASCFTCQQVKDVHQHPTTLLHPIPIPEWKWETITMDFIMGLLRTKKHNDSIMVVVDKSSNETRYIPIKSTYKAINIIKLYPFL